MQYILTHEEFNNLVNKSNDDLLREYDNLKACFTKLSIAHSELKDNYAKLLVHGVSLNNERLKSTKG